jgi:hypothetical protein
MTDQLFVTPMPRSWEPDQIRALFEQVGPVKHVTRPRDRDAGEYRKFAFVTMASEELAAAAIERMNGVEVEGSPLVVKLADKPGASEKPKAKAKPKPAAQEKPQPALQPPALPEFAWAERVDTLERVMAVPGTATTVKITVVGRPGWVEPRNNVVIVGLTHSLKPTGYPKGVPTPPDTPTTYVVFIGNKQWKKVAEAIENPEDVLIIEGQPMMDGALPAVTVFATNVNTKLLQQASKAKPAEGEEPPA